MRRPARRLVPALLVGRFILACRPRGGARRRRLGGRAALSDLRRRPRRRPGKVRDHARARPDRRLHGRGMTMVFPSAPTAASSRGSRSGDRISGTLVVDGDRVLDRRRPESRRRPLRARRPAAAATSTPVSAVVTPRPESRRRRRRSDARLHADGPDGPRDAAVRVRRRARRGHLPLHALSDRDGLPDDDREVLEARRDARRRRLRAARSRSRSIPSTTRRRCSPTTRSGPARTRGAGSS